VAKYIPRFRLTSSFLSEAVTIVSIRDHSSLRRSCIFDSCERQQSVDVSRYLMSRTIALINLACFRSRSRAIIITASSISSILGILYHRSRNAGTAKYRTCGNERRERSECKGCVDIFETLASLHR
jgi:hypothetical protein